MLDIIGIKASSVSHVHVDHDVPLTIEFEGDEREMPLYWRARALDGALVEVGVSRSDGTLRSVTLTSMGAARVERSHSSSTRDAQDSGLPLIDTTPWSSAPREFVEYFVDENVSLRFVLGESSATIWFTKNSTPHSWILNERVRFGMSERGALMCVGVVDLSGEDISTIAAAADA